MKHWALCGVFFVGLVINVMIHVQRDSGMEQTERWTTGPQKAEEDFKM